MDAGLQFQMCIHWLVTSWDIIEQLHGDNIQENTSAADKKV